MMTVTIAIPTPLRSYTDNEKKVKINASTIKEALNNLIDAYPSLQSHLFEDGKLRNFVNIYLNDEDVRYLDNKDTTKLSDGDEIAIIPSIAGGI